MRDVINGSGQTASGNLSFLHTDIAPGRKAGVQSFSEKEKGFLKDGTLDERVDKCENEDWS